MERPETGRNLDENTSALGNKRRRSISRGNSRNMPHSRRRSSSKSGDLAFVMQHVSPTTGPRHRGGTNQTPCSFSPKGLLMRYQSLAGTADDRLSA